MNNPEIDQPIPNTVEDFTKIINDSVLGKAGHERLGKPRLQRTSKPKIHQDPAIIKENKE